MFVTFELFDLGDSILTAEDGEEGLVLLKQKTPDLIITDIMMPKINGVFVG